VVTNTSPNTLRQLSLGISPCPNDTFIFHAWMHGLVPQIGGFTFGRQVMADVEELNALASRGELDVIKISMAAMADAAVHYRLLPCGGALGRGCGPLLVARADRDPREPLKTLALPGLRTTAALLARLAGIGGEQLLLRYDEIMPAVAQGRVDAGVLIHEGRFTYAEKGLQLLLDFGAFWEETYKLPLPLGVIAIKRELGPQTAALAARAIRESLEHAWKRPADSRAFVAANAQELSPAVTAAHIEMFVNPFSLDVGLEGRKAIAALARTAFEAAGKGDAPEDLFWEI